MAQNPAALHPEPATRPRPHRPALVATPGASEWLSCVSSPATNRLGRTPEKGAGNLANSPGALRISLNDTVSQRPVQKFCSTVSRREHNDDVAAASTRATSPIDAGTTSLMQRERRWLPHLVQVHRFRACRRRVAPLRSRAGPPIMEAHQCFALAHWAASE